MQWGDSAIWWSTTQHRYLPPSSRLWSTTIAKPDHDKIAVNRPHARSKLHSVDHVLYDTINRATNLLWSVCDFIYSFRWTYQMGVCRHDVPTTLWLVTLFVTPCYITINHHHEPAFSRGLSWSLAHHCAPFNHHSCSTWSTWLTNTDHGWPSLIRIINFKP